jgi:hypothetical protein
LARRYAETDDPLLPCIDPTQQRYELIRPLLLCPERTATQRAQETGTHPDTVGRLKRQSLLLDSRVVEFEYGVH